MNMPVDQTPTEPIEIPLYRSVQVGGFIQDDQGKPVKGVTVRVIAQVPNLPRNLGIRVTANATIRTDDQGQWLSPPLPYSDHIYLRLNHPDYTLDSNFKDNLAPIDELRSGIATIVIKK